MFNLAAQIFILAIIVFAVTWLIATAMLARRDGQARMRRFIREQVEDKFWNNVRLCDEADRKWLRAHYYLGEPDHETIPVHSALERHLDPGSVHSNQRQS